MDSRPPTVPGRWAGALGFVLPGLLIVLVIAGLLGAVRTPGWTGRYHTDGPVVGVALEVVLVVLFGVLLVRSRRERAAPDFLAARLRTALGYLIVAGMVAIPVALLLNAHLHISGKRRPLKPLPSPAPSTRRPTPTPTPKPHGSIHLGVLPYVLLAVIVLAAVVVCVVLVARHRPAGSGQGSFEGFEEEPEEDLRAAVESGRTALRSLDDAQAAIIACYVAMESSLARAGATRDVAETPDELLARAAAAGLARGGAAARLTALFYEARFSTHPLQQAHKAAAEHALAEIAADLAQRQPAEPAGDRT